MLRKNDPVHVIIAGTTALDTIETPFGKARDTLGGSAVYAALAARLFAPVGVVSIAGADFPKALLNFAQSQIDLGGLIYKGKTFRWRGSYEYTMELATTHKTELGSLATWKPSIPERYRGAEVVFVGNLAPALQHQLLDWAHARHPRPYLMLDTMNYWIEHTRPALEKAIERVDLLVINENEARMLTRQPNLVRAGQMLLAEGPQSVIIKKGEHGSLIFSAGSFFTVPGYPLEEVRDPTGAGDSFAGTIAGTIADRKGNSPKFKDLVAAVRTATVVASFTTETLGTERLAKLNRTDIGERLKAYTKFTQIVLQ